MIRRYPSEEEVLLVLDLVRQRRPGVGIETCRGNPWRQATVAWMTLALQFLVQMSLKMVRVDCSRTRCLNQRVVRESLLMLPPPELHRQRFRRQEE